MTKIGTKHNLHTLASWTAGVHNVGMKNFHNPQNRCTNPNTIADLRAAYGPGFQFSGPTDAVLRMVSCDPKR